MIRALRAWQQYREQRRRRFFAQDTVYQRQLNRLRRLTVAEKDQRLDLIRRDRLAKAERRKKNLNP